MRSNTECTSLSTLQVLGIAATAALSAWLSIWLVRSLRAPVGEPRHARREQQHRDNTLADTFPASDPPSSRDFAIPVNAR